MTSESGRTRQIRGYLVADLIAAADAARDGCRTVLPQAQQACTREPGLFNAPVTARDERP